MVARGSKAPLSGSRILFASKQRYWDKYTMHSETDGSLGLMSCRFFGKLSGIAQKDLVESN
jgi:hypothetical protein